MSGKVKFTRGPWEVTGGGVSFHRVPRFSQKDDGGGFEVRHQIPGTGIGTICHMTYLGIPKDRQEVEATARLIAAAPDLYDACRDALRAFVAIGQGDGVEFPAEEKLRRALRRADGAES